MELAQKLFSTRGGTLVLAGIAAVLAVVIVLVYVHNYKSSVKSSGAPASVLVARSLIPKGTPGSQVAQSHLFQVATIRESQLRNGALSDASSLAGKVAAVDIFPGQQLTTADFVAATGAIAGSLTGTERAITLPLDSAHGLIGTVRAGDQVDIYAGFNIAPVDSSGNPIGSGGRPVLRLIAQAVPVLAAGGSGKGGIGGSGGVVNVTLRVDPQLAAELAFASDNGKLWLTLRPPVGGKASPPNLVTAETILLGIPPIKELQSLGGRR